MIRAMISESLRAIISQTLLKTKDGSGRVAAHEIMIGTPAIRNLIRENKIAQMYSAIQTGQQFGMQTLDQNLQDLVQAQRHLDGRGARQGGEQGQLRRLAQLPSASAQRSKTCRRIGWKTHGTEQATKFMYDLLRLMLQQEGLRPVHHRRLPAGDEARRQDDAGVAAEAHRASTPRMLVRAIMNDKQAAEFEATKECNFAIAPAGIGRFRVNCFVQQGNVGMVLRTITTTIPKFEDLGLPPVLKDVVDDQARPGDHGGRHRLGQVDLARGDDRLPQRELATATSSPSRTRSSTCTRTRTA